jgi:DNA-binding NarL/FixJ family response regulator
MDSHVRSLILQQEYGLTKPETKLLRLLLDGYGNKSISQLLEMPLRIVEKTRVEIIRKFGCSSMDEVLKKANQPPL